MTHEGMIPMMAMGRAVEVRTETVGGVQGQGSGSGMPMMPSPRLQLLAPVAATRCNCNCNTLHCLSPPATAQVTPHAPLRHPCHGAIAARQLHDSMCTLHGMCRWL